MRISVDIGGTKISFGLLDENTQLLFFDKTETEKEKGYEFVRDKVVNSILKILSANSVTIKDLTRIGIACAGQIDIKTGTVKFSPNLKWRDAPLGKDIESIFSVETFVENDVNAATYGEWKFAFGAESENVIGVFLGTGVGGGIILNKRIYRGFNFVGGEIGHMILNPEGYLCNCGSRGCFEAVCGGDYIIRRVRHLIAEGYRGKLWELAKASEEIHMSHIEKAYYLGDEGVKRLWEEVIEYLGCGLTSLVNVFNPDLLIVGGGVIKGTERLFAEAKKIVEQRAMPESRNGVRIEVARLGDWAALLGIASLDG
ncbi:MAG: ROK family protein [Deltaproteobacteria bacterium]|nr:ROK family protein [Deltaproteobacteria bacterium]